MNTDSDRLSARDIDLVLYRENRTFQTKEQLDAYLGRPDVFTYTKRLYFDEVENANVWSFYLVDRDLHHAFEELVIAEELDPYAIWSKQENSTLGGARSTFPISETAAIYRLPVPKAGDTIDYVVEILEMSDKAATFGFLGYRRPYDNLQEFGPSVTATWVRTYVQYDGDKRGPVTIPSKLRNVLDRHVDSECRWNEKSSESS